MWPSLMPLASPHLLTRIIVPGTQCGPSRSALHTGRHPVRIGRSQFNVKPHEFPFPRSGFDPNDRQLAEAFHDVGYSTYGFGKW